MVSLKFSFKYLLYKLYYYVNWNIKKKIFIFSSTMEYLSKASRLLSVNELIDTYKDNNLYNEFYVSYLFIYLFNL